MQPAVRYSADGGVVWTTPTRFGNVATAAQWHFNRFYDLDASQGPLFEIGLHTSNLSGTALNLARVNAEITFAPEARRDFLEAVRRPTSNTSHTAAPYVVDFATELAASDDVTWDTTNKCVTLSRAGDYELDLYVSVRQTVNSVETQVLVFFLQKWNGSAWASYEATSLITLLNYKNSGGAYKGMGSSKTFIVRGAAAGDRFRIQNTYVSDSLGHELENPSQLIVRRLR